MTVVTESVRPPSKLLWAAELPRAAWTVMSLPRHTRRLRSEPVGDGRPVLLLPGLMQGERSFVLLRRFLRQRGYQAHYWGFGRNLGARTIGTQAERLIERIEAIAATSGPVTLIGVSLGGMIARLVAQRRPDLIREVITISSPFAGSAKATNVWRFFEWITGERLDDPAVAARSAEIAAPLSVPTTAIWSRSDGLVAGEICRDDHGRSIEINSSHLGVQLRPDVFLAVAGVLEASAEEPPAGRA
ncbi:esterase/lipase family protein [Sandarakinorhabdus oryzae]|uniref:esterase/lipase family protein n=1 Tax=Sandarakinorhabdus oryzae TaxID=2675220 RepID=UPI0012E28B94|nr:alpha/beta hydrolase [Sandarakinorhabdus oryzae]